MKVVPHVVEKIPVLHAQRDTTFHNNIKDFALKFRHVISFLTAKIAI